MNAKIIQLEEGNLRISLKGSSTSTNQKRVGQIAICVESHDPKKPLTIVNLPKLGRHILSFLTQDTAAETSAAAEAERKREALWALLDQAVSDTFETFRLSDHTGRALHRGGFRWMGEVVQKKKDTLMRLQDFGSGSAKNIKTALRRFDLHLGMTRDELLGWVPPGHESRRKPFVPLPDPVRPPIADPAIRRRRDERWDRLDYDIRCLEIMVRTYNVLDREVGESCFLGELVQKTEAEMLQWKRFGRESLKDLQQALSGFNLRLGMANEELMDWVPPTHPSRKRK